uniref:ETS variant transcription factor 2 n=1 Tax=Aotus nancymaae TaxID=37293 RepID=A0A2K5D028_AOTNA
MDLWNWDEASPQEVPPGNKLAGLEGAEFGFYVPDLALQGDMPTATAETCWKGTSSSLAGFPQLDWGSALLYPEVPWGAEPDPQALPWSGNWTDMACTAWDSWSGVSQTLGPAPPGPGPAPAACSEGAAAAHGLYHFVARAHGPGLYHLLEPGAVCGWHHFFEGVPELSSHRFFGTEPAVGPCQFGSLPQN